MLMLAVDLALVVKFNWKVLPELSGFVCANHPATLGSSPKHTIYALSFIVKFVLYLSCENNENKQNEAGFAPFNWIE